MAAVGQRLSWEDGSFPLRKDWFALDSYKTGGKKKWSKREDSSFSKTI